MMSSPCSFPIRPSARLPAFACPAGGSPPRRRPRRPAPSHDAGGIFTAPGYPLRNTGAQCDPRRGAGAGLGATARAACPGQRWTSENGNGGPRTSRRSERRLPAPRGAGAAAEAERIPALRRRPRPAGCCRSSAATFFADAADNFQSARQRAGLGRLHDRPRRRDRHCAPGARSTSTTAARSTATACSTCRRSAASTSPASRPPTSRSNLRAQIGRLYTNFNLSVVARAAARRSRCSSSGRRSGPASTRCRASRRCCRRSSPPAGRRRTARCARSCCAATASVDLRARRLRIPGPGRQVEGRAARRRRRRRLPAGGPRVALTGAIDTPRDLRAEERRRSRCASCCAMPAARRCSPNPNRVQLERIDPSQPTAARFVEKFRARCGRPAEAAARRRRR